MSTGEFIAFTVVALGCCSGNSFGALHTDVVVTGSTLGPGYVRPEGKGPESVFFAFFFFFLLCTFTFCNYPIRAYYVW